MNVGRWCAVILMSISTGLSGCQLKDPKYQLYYVEGEQLYNKHCSNCHQKNGTGLGRLYPPLANADYIDQHFDEIGCLIKYGRKGEMLVNGERFNQPMPGVPLLTELEIAEIMTYVGNTWGHEKGLIDVRSVSGKLETCISE